MNTLMSDALKSAGVKEEEARAAAVEVGRNDLRFLAMEYAFDKLYSQMDKNATELRKGMVDLRTDMANLRTDIIENQNRNANRQLENTNRLFENANRNSRSELMIMLGGISVGVTVTIGWITILLIFLP